MRVTRLRTEVVRLPLPRPIPSGRLTIASADCILVFLESDDGAVGEGLVFTLNGHHLSVVHQMLHGLEPLVLGADPQAGEAFWARAFADLAFIGQSGVGAIALAGLDMALWDLRGKAADRNVADLLGRTHASMPLYRSGGLRLSQSIDELQREASDFVAQGFRAMKMSLGSADPRVDRERVAAVREAIGPHVALMGDCNQQLDAERAIHLGRQLESFDLAWIEEPVPQRDLEASAQVAEALRTPIASGENAWLHADIQAMIRAGAADLLMPDLQRMAGPTELVRAARAAERAGLPVSLHLFSEMSVCLASAMPHAQWLEYMPWFAAIYEEPLRPDAAGRVSAPAAAGWGRAFDRDAVVRHRV